MPDIDDLAIEEDEADEVGCCNTTVAMTPMETVSEALKMLVHSPAVSLPGGPNDFAAAECAQRAGLMRCPAGSAAGAAGQHQAHPHIRPDDQLR